uniref:Uncharacterized protein n=1 Tax=Nelumbo nucifera TaxID=4432 RepID=A0A822XCA8_NELNU|nr:TPA_asm: hypothetical protein HUJ06_019434 [Nelumbo nucifera]
MGVHVSVVSSINMYVCMCECVLVCGLTVPSSLSLSSKTIKSMNV